ncbi:unnamed protein product [Nezara viridula]|uniref:VWFC domain-containing protein n=1 Tax=Nezara viridula TaxID=85310 RepID=A0A9P0HDS8_NEZVI|nr:unnamed protein product [Nezara viridula]
MFFVLCISVVLGFAAGQLRTEPAKQYYRELGCTELEGETNAYNCSSLAELSETKKCFHNHKSYKVKDVIKGDDIGYPCAYECICQKGYKSKNANWQCVHIECPDLFNPPKPDCIRLYTHEKCCSEKTYCPATDPPMPHTCEYKGVSYVEGQKFVDGCKNCICQKGFNGTLVEPFCKPITCEFYLHYSDYIQDGCVPTYYEPNDCCPVPIWRCPQESDVVITQKNIEDQSGLKCKFGNLELAIGNMLSPSEENKCVECSCQVPPHLTCLMNTTCYSQH